MLSRLSAIGTNLRSGGVPGGDGSGSSLLALKEPAMLFSRLGVRGHRRIQQPLFVGGLGEHGGPWGRAAAASESMHARQRAIASARS